jgi:sn-glycerol 3-phosphate transport system substrate-binding protein
MNDENGNLLSMPFNSSTPVMYYNVDLFKKAGIEPALQRTEPLTWDQVGDMLTAKTGRLRRPRKAWLPSWQSWTQVENYSAIHMTSPFATKGQRLRGPGLRTD